MALSLRHLMGSMAMSKSKVFWKTPFLLLDILLFIVKQGIKSIQLQKLFPSSKGTFTLALEGVTTRTDAEQLKGAKELMLPREKLPTLEEDTFYHADLIGLDVVTLNDQALGTVYALYNFGAGDILEVKTLTKKLVMIPFTCTILPEVDIKKGLLRVSEEGEKLLTGENDGD